MSSEGKTEMDILEEIIQSLNVAESSVQESTVNRRPSPYQNDEKINEMSCEEKLDLYQKMYGEVWTTNSEKEQMLIVAREELNNLKKLIDTLKEKIQTLQGRKRKRRKTDNIGGRRKRKKTRNKRKKKQKKSRRR